MQPLTVFFVCTGDGAPRAPHVVPPKTPAPPPQPNPGAVPEARPAADGNNSAQSPSPAQSSSYDDVSRTILSDDDTDIESWSPGNDQQTKTTKRKATNGAAGHARQPKVRGPVTGICK